MVKKYLLLLLLSFSFSFAHALPELKPLEDYMLLGEFDLRAEQGFSKPVVDRTLNHEGGLKIRVIETGAIEAFQETKGQWIKIQTTTSLWLESGIWIPKQTVFWIFLTEDITVCPVKE